MTKYNHFSKIDTPFDESRYGDIPAKKLYEAAEQQGRKKFKYYLKQAYFGNKDNAFWSMKYMAEVYKRCRDVDMGIPIILTPDGWPCDGQHRIARAIAEEREYIWAYRLLEMPESNDE